MEPPTCFTLTTYCNRPWSLQPALLGPLALKHQSLQPALRGSLTVTDHGASNLLLILGPLTVTDHGTPNLFYSDHLVVLWNTTEPPPCFTWITYCDRPWSLKPALLWPLSVTDHGSCKLLYLDHLLWQTVEPSCCTQPCIHLFAPQTLLVPSPDRTHSLQPSGHSKFQKH